MTPTQSKEDNTGGIKNTSSATIHDRAGLFFGAFGMAVAFLSIGIACWAISESRDLKTQVLLLREDIRQMTIEAAKGK